MVPSVNRRQVPGHPGWRMYHDGQAAVSCKTHGTQVRLASGALA
jgi:hypothetical protein